MKYLLVLSVVAALCVTGDALKCYECSRSSTSCSDPLDKSAPGVREVKNDSGCYCMKAVANMRGVKITERSCISLSEYALHSRAEIRNPDTVSINFCKTDLCNGATRTRITLMLLALPLIFMLWQ